LTVGNCPLPDVVRGVKTFGFVQVPSVAVVEKTWLIDESLLVTLHQNPYQPVEGTINGKHKMELSWTTWRHLVQAVLQEQPQQQQSTINSCSNQ